MFTLYVHVRGTFKEENGGHDFSNIPEGNSEDQSPQTRVVAEEKK